MRFLSNATLAIALVLPATARAQDGLSGTWQTVLPSGEAVTVDLVADGVQLEGSVDFENGRVERITEGTVEAITDGSLAIWRVRFVTTGLLNGNEVFLLWDGETAGSREEITMWTAMQLPDGREIELYSPRAYVRLDEE